MAQSRSALTLVPLWLASTKHWPSDASASARDHSAVIIGNRIAFPAGIVHLRLAEPPGVPAKNHTGPSWFTPHFSPVLSTVGLSAVGIASSHCHHAADNSLTSLFCANALGVITSRPNTI